MNSKPSKPWTRSSVSAHAALPNSGMTFSADRLKSTSITGAEAIDDSRTPYHPSISPDFPEGREGDEPLEAGLDASDAALE